MGPTAAQRLETLGTTDDDVLPDDAAWKEEAVQIVERLRKLSPAKRSSRMARSRKRLGLTQGLRQSDRPRFLFVRADVLLDHRAH